MMFTLAQPNGGFRWTQIDGREALVCTALEPFALHFFTARQWKLGERTPESTNGWMEVAQAAGVGVEHFGRMHQVHGADVVTYKEGERAPGGHIPTADIAITNDPAIAVAVQTADCLPILIVDRQRGVVAAAHAGWRGLAARVAQTAIGRMGSDFGSRPGDLLVAAGPAIGACCYEVGEDVRATFADAGFSSGQVERWFGSQPLTLSPENPPMRSLGKTSRPGHWFFDGWACVREQTEEAGVPAGQIFVANLCTASHEETFCSYRRDGASAGRMAGVIRPGPSLR
jgi:YfiH family protein